MHPSWYYEFFEKVFSRGSAYAREAELLEEQLGGFNGLVTEVGAGTGNHAAAVLERGVEDLVLIDHDRVAIDLLESRFHDDKRVSLQCDDGFRHRMEPWCDRVFAMYSLAQQARDIEEVAARIRSLVEHVHDGGAVAIEAIDAEVSKAEFPGGQTTRLYEGRLGWMDICSTYHEGAICISYAGVLNSELCRYTLQLIAAEPAWMEDVLVNNGVDIRKRQVLDESGRRLLLGGLVNRRYG